MTSVVFPKMLLLKSSWGSKTGRRNAQYYPPNSRQYHLSRLTRTQDNLEVDNDDSNPNDSVQSKEIVSNTNLLEQRNFFDNYAKLNHLNTQKQWYSTKATDIMAQPGGSSLLVTFYHKSLFQALSAVYPEYTWLPWQFDKAPSGFWQSVTHQREYCDWILSQSTTNTTDTRSLKDQLYSLKRTDIIDNGGRELLEIYSSIPQLLITLYPEAEWQSSEVVEEIDYQIKQNNRQLARGFWNSPDNIQNYLTQYLAPKLRISQDNLEDWYRVSNEQIIQLGGSRLLDVLAANREGLYDLLVKCYPQFPWDQKRFEISRGKKASQRWLRILLQEIYPSQEILEDFAHPDLFFASSKENMELDIYIPALSLAFEYQGHQHYHDVHYFGPQKQYMARDEEKKRECVKKGITLIEVPYWWDKKKASLEEIIQKAGLNKQEEAIQSSQARQQIIQEAPIITREPPTIVHSKEDEIHRHHIMMLGRDWDERMDPTGWWMSEKYDGVRALWDGQQLHSRQGKVIHPPASFLEGFPSTPLDGELWINRGRYAEAYNITTTKDESKWKHVKYCVFDIPPSTQTPKTTITTPMDPNTPFEDRYRHLQQLLVHQQQPKQLLIVRMIPCEGRDHLQRYLKQILDLGGEGVMLRDPRSSYTYGRSSSLLKVKQYKDIEVRLIDRNQGNFGLDCEQPDGQTVLVKCTLQTFQNPPKQGSIITVRHQGFHKSGKLKYPFFVRERSDINQSDILESFLSQQRQQRSEHVH